MAGRLRLPAAAMLASVLFAGCASSMRPAIAWRIAFTAVIVNEVAPTAFTFTPAAPTQTVLQVTARVTPAHAAPSPSAVAAAVWIPPWLGAHVDPTLVSPPPADPAAFAGMRPGRAWILVADSVATRAIAGSVPIVRGTVPATDAQGRVLTLEWKDPDGARWLERFAVDGRPLGRARLVRTPAS